MSEERFSVVYGLAIRASRFRARSAVRRRAVPPADHDDLTQELLIACWRGASKFDPARASLRTFLECVVASRASSFIRAARRMPTVESLDAALDYCVGPGVQALQLRVDIARTLKHLDGADRRIAFALMEGSPTEASRRLRVARSTVYQRMGRIRARFVDAGLGPTDIDFRGTSE